MQCVDMKSSHFLQAKNIIRERAREDISVRDVADAVGISSSLLYRIFAQNGLSPLSYLLVCRIDMARQQLLDDPNRSVAMVAQDCGFHDSAYFCKVFRRQVGMTPNGYRQRFL